MNESMLRDLLSEVADHVEPGDRLDAIRARTRPSRRRHLWIPAGAALVAASVVGAVALGGGPVERADAPGPAGTSNVSPSPSPTEPSPTEPTPTAPETRAVAVYYVGVTPDGPRLYREFREALGQDRFEAATAAIGNAPLDPDYANLWPAEAIGDVSFVGTGADGLISITLSDASYRDRPAGMTPEEAGLAVEQVIRTFQAAVQARTPVQFRLGDNPIDQVLGVPSSEPLSQGPDLDVLALVSLSTPSEGQVVDKAEPLVVSGAGNSFEGTIVTRLQRPDGSEAIDPVPAIAGTYEERLFPFEASLDISDLPAGEYVVLARTDDPSGEGRFHEDTRRITISD